MSGSTSLAPGGSSFRLAPHSKCGREGTQEGTRDAPQQAEGRGEGPRAAPSTTHHRARVQGIHEILTKVGMQLAKGGMDHVRIALVSCGVAGSQSGSVGIAAVPRGQRGWHGPMHPGCTG